MPDAPGKEGLIFEISKQYLASSAFRFLEGQSSETIRRVLAKLSDPHADYTIGETLCALGTINTAMTSDESHAQLALFAAGVEAK